MLSLLSDDDLPLCQAAIAGVAGRAGAEITSALLPLLGHEAWQVRELALEALADRPVEEMAAALELWVAGMGDVVSYRRAYEPLRNLAYRWAHGNAMSASLIVSLDSFTKILAASDGT